jgi:Fatty acid hydroxylase superfamily
MGWAGFIEAVWQKLIYTQVGLLALGCTMTVIGAAYTFLTHDYHHEPRTLRGFLRFCLPPHIVMGQQTRLDLVYATIKKAVRFLWARAFVGDIAFAYFFYAAFGPLFRSGGATSLHHTPTSLERGVFLAVGIVVLDFFTFFAHYLQHKIPLMWQFHKVHHSALVLVPMTNLRFHPVQEVWDALWNSAGVGAWIALFSCLTAAPLMDVTILNVNAVILVSCFTSTSCGTAISTCAIRAGSSACS